MMPALSVSYPSKWPVVRSPVPPGRDIDAALLTAGCRRQLNL
jgi:hypothetical protein